MRFKLDENLPLDLKALLVRNGHDAHSVFDENLGGSADPAIYQASQAESRILITLDLDFTDIRTYPPVESPGLIVLRLPQQDKNSVLEIFPSVLTLLKTEPIQQRLWIVEPKRVRIRE